MKWILRLLPVSIIFLGVAVLFPDQESQTPQGQGSSDSIIFSHRFHLKELQADCKDCHSAALSSTTVEEVLLPKEATCLKCHDGVKARKDCEVCHTAPASARSFPEPHRTFRFNHAQHLELGNLAPVIAAALDGGQYLSDPKDIRKHLETESECVACHRGLDQTDLATTAHLRQMADCLICHSQIDPPFTCGNCHTPDTQLKPDSHSSDFIDRHSSKHFQLDKSGCKVCHGTNFRCMGCH